MKKSRAEIMRLREAQDANARLEQMEADIALIKDAVCGKKAGKGKQTGKVEPEKVESEKDKPEDTVEQVPGEVIEAEKAPTEQE